MFPSEPTSQAEFRDCNVELPPEKLQRIFAGPSEIDFGSIYVKSESAKYFAVRNENREAIKVQVFADEHEELKLSYTKPQIIPSSQTAGFKLVFSSFGLQNFKRLVTYKINDVHTFKFMVEAQVDPVKLELEKSQQVFSFSDTNMEMETSQMVTIKNSGNAPGQFYWAPDTRHERSHIGTSSG